jgi:hypothetical protein
MAAIHDTIYGHAGCLGLDEVIEERKISNLSRLYVIYRVQRFAIIFSRLFGFKAIPIIGIELRGRAVFQHYSYGMLYSISYFGFWRGFS